MEYFAGLDVSMEETHVCVVDRDGKIILEARAPTAPKIIAAALAKGPPFGRQLESDSQPLGNPPPIQSGCDML